jgi:classical protein kinase C
VRNEAEDVPPTPPPKDASQWGQRGAYGSGPEQYGRTGQQGDMMPLRPPFPGQPPDSTMPKSRPNFTKLGLLHIESRRRGFTC